MLLARDEGGQLRRRRWGGESLAGRLLGGKGSESEAERLNRDSRWSMPLGSSRALLRPTAVARRCCRRQEITLSHHSTPPCTACAITTTHNDWQHWQHSSLLLPLSFYPLSTSSAPLLFKCDIGTTHRSRCPSHSFSRYHRLLSRCSSAALLLADLNFPPRPRPCRCPSPRRSRRCSSTTCSPSKARTCSSQSVMLPPADSKGFPLFRSPLPCSVWHCRAEGAVSV